MTSANVQQHLHHATVPVAIHNFIGNADPHHGMAGADPQHTAYVPFDRPHVGSRLSSAITLKYRTLVIGAGPAGVMFLLKLLEEIREKAKNHLIDCQIVVLEKRESFGYPSSYTKEPIVEGANRERDDIWNVADTASWPTCVKQRRFRNVKGQWDTLENALKSHVNYTVLRHDILVALGQLWHAVFGHHNNFHFISNASVSQASLPEMERSIRGHIPAAIRSNFHPGRGMMYVLSWGWRERGAANLIIDQNTWNDLGKNVEIRAQFDIQLSEHQTSQREAAIQFLTRLATDCDRLSVQKIEQDGPLQFSQDIPVSAIHKLTESLAAKHQAWSDFSLRELPTAIGDSFIRGTAMEIFLRNVTINEKLVASRIQQLSLGGEHKVSVGIDRSAGFWEKIHRRTDTGALVVILGSAALSHISQLVPHLDSACVFGKIAAHSEFNSYIELDTVLRDFEKYVAHALRDDVSVPIREYGSLSDDFLYQVFAPILRQRIKPQLQALQRQMDKINATQLVIHVPVVDKWAESVLSAAGDTLICLRTFETQRGIKYRGPRIFHAAFYPAIQYLLKEVCKFSNDQVDARWKASREFHDKEQASMPDWYDTTSEKRKEMIEMSRRISADLASLTLEEVKSEILAKK